MNNVILARRYAKALFALGRESEELEGREQGLAAAAALFADQEVRDALTNPLYPPEARKQAMDTLAKGVGADPGLAGLLALVADKNRAAILPEIADEFRKLADRQRNISHGVVISAAPLNEALLARARALLEKLAGTRVALENRVDPAIIGGIIARVGDLELDGSIRTQLEGLKESIKGRA